MATICDTDCPFPRRYGVKSLRTDGALRATLVASFTPRQWRRFLDRGGDPADLDGRHAHVLARRLRIGSAEAAALARKLRRADPAGERARAETAGVRIHTWDDEGYPAPLRELADSPPAIYVRGGMIACDAQAVAVIGARRPTPYGLRIARALAGDLARAGVTVVAGLARGIDAAAHDGALRAGGRTIAVLGSGLLEPYPPEHLELLERAAAAGAVVSEFPLHAPPLRHHFPQRNRIVAALSLAVVVVEATTRSGAMSTVRHALDLGRAVLAVPGPVDRDTSRGTLRMLQDGAAPAGSAHDVFAALGWCDVARAKLPEEERAVLEALGEGGGSATDVACATGLPEEVAAGLLVTLELRGLATREKGGVYVPN